MVTDLNKKIKTYLEEVKSNLSNLVNTRIYRVKDT